MKTPISLRYAALSAVVLAVGCAGDGPVHLPSGLLNFVGQDVVAGNVQSDTVVPATGGAQVTVAGVSGTTVIPSGSVPPGTVVTTSDNVVVVPAGTGFLGTPSTSADITVNEVSDSGATVASNGVLGVNMALPVEEGGAGTEYILDYPATSLNTSRNLTVQKMRFRGKIYVKTGPLRVYSPLPIKLKGSLPNNGENAVGSYMNVWWNPINAGRTATLFIDYGNGFTLQKTQTIDASGYAAFGDLVVDSSVVPANGVALVRFTVGPLP